MTIYFLRHGDASGTVQLDDSERPLSELGERQASAVARHLAAIHPAIEQIFCSQLLRARQTAETVQRSVGPTPLQPTESLAASSDPRDILRELKRSGPASVLLVGHEPHLSKTISLLLWGDTKSRVDMGKCSLASVSIPDALEEGTGILQWLTPSSQTMRG